MDNVSSDTDFITYLDDDDYFVENCLQTMKQIIKEKPNFFWFLTNVIYPDGKKITQVVKYNQEYNYLNDHFMGSKIAGDATDFLQWDKVKDFRFSKIIKQEAQFLYFVEIAQFYNFYAYDYNSKIVEYLEGGLMKTAQHNIFLILYEIIFLRKYSLKIKCKLMFFRLISNILGILKLKKIVKKLLKINYK